MRNYHQLFAIIAGTAIMSGIVVALPNVAQALPGREVNDTTHEVTVLIRNDGGYGFGMMRDSGSSGYYTLTADRVAKQPKTFKLVVDVNSVGMSGVSTFDTARRLIKIHGMGDLAAARSSGDKTVSKLAARIQPDDNFVTSIAIFLQDAVSVENPDILY